MPKQVIKPVGPAVHVKGQQFETVTVKTGWEKFLEICGLAIMIFVLIGIGEAIFGTPPTATNPPVYQR